VSSAGRWARRLGSAKHGRNAARSGATIRAAQGVELFEKQKGRSLGPAFEI
jgi:hypothetical protein